jgi:hypothetical protein
MAVERFATNLDSAVEDEQKRTGSLQLLNWLVHVLPNGRTTGPEDVVDVPTLKDLSPAGEDRGTGQSFIEGLVLMARCGLKELPSGHNSNGLRAIEKRVYICDKYVHVPDACSHVTDITSSSWNDLTDTMGYTDVQP